MGKAGGIHNTLWAVSDDQSTTPLGLVGSAKVLAAISLIRRRARRADSQKNFVVKAAARAFLAILVTTASARPFISLSS